ncbi:hypothetical protein OSB04_006514 [Centaurea solstitialis]|uniref:Zinc finger PMZ-type domain-containing protein n=1 Tax=Centaurea solstitialis TaxID=347529 RepID=A0AA38TJU6_9ASTR|nr:hypothetical protein OSB04_006514 [Centaurea solstitialis]
MEGALAPNASEYLKTISKARTWVSINYQVIRRSDNRVEVNCRKKKRWEVLLDNKKCSCRVWQVKGLLCVYAVAFIAFTGETNWDKYVDPCFTIEKI